MRLLTHGLHRSRPVNECWKMTKINKNNTFCIVVTCIIELQNWYSFLLSFAPFRTARIAHAALFSASMKSLSSLPREVIQHITVVDSMEPKKNSNSRIVMNNKSEICCTRSHFCSANCCMFWPGQTTSKALKLQFLNESWPTTLSMPFTQNPHETSALSVTVSTPLSHWCSCVYVSCIHSFTSGSLFFLSCQLELTAYHTPNSIPASPKPRKSADKTRKTAKKKKKQKQIIAANTASPHSCEKTETESKPSHL